MRPLPLLLMFGLGISTGSAGAQSHQPAGAKCYKIGDTGSVKGRIVPGVNGGTYFELADHICVHFPKPPDRFTPTDLTTVGDKLPATGYLEVTGQLVDLFPLGLYGIGIKSTDNQDVDAEVRAGIEQVNRQSVHVSNGRMPTRIR